MALAQLLDALLIPGAPRAAPVLGPKPSSGGCFYLHSATTTSPPPNSPPLAPGNDPSGSGGARSGAGGACASPSPASPACTHTHTAAGGAGPQPPRELPRDALEQVLRRCDSDTLVGTVPAVCRAWREAAGAVAVWRERLAARLQAELEPLSGLGPAVSPGRLHLILQGRNLLRNPTFRKDANSQLPLGRTAATARSKWQRSAWVTTAAMGDGVAWELPPSGIRAYGTAAHPHGAPPAPPPYPGNGNGNGAAGGGGGGGGSVRLVAAARLMGLFGNGSGGFGPAGRGCGGEDGGGQQQGCLATGNDWCEVVQVVDLQWELQRRGLSAAQAAHLLDAGLGLRLAVHVGSRWDCVGQYSVGLVLDEGSAGNANGYGGDGCVAEGDDVLPSLQSFVMRPTRHHFWLGRAMCTSDSWQRFEYVVPACPRGFRRAVVMLRGRRAPNSLIVSPMPRFCGAKFSAAELVFC
ncbi:hypothetical protein HXX76_000354 [Chlamydomonas incerta]|uniref:F-box domain-containing protein n=1 Tax=Chlamydomonas incerta TaxID=51695 RepID=A0A836B2T3_CHLIN|nr:hypothetical protein HXX76_000354 [Chlamydomonas incerta]|eukprot:KAG2445748.1 hypothetical protein HXX76_000354 [Chlamydomonas incerta]